MQYANNLLYLFKVDGNQHSMAPYQLAQPKYERNNYGLQQAAQNYSGAPVAQGSYGWPPLQMGYSTRYQSLAQVYAPPQLSSLQAPQPFYSQYSMISPFQVAPVYAPYSQQCSYPVVLQSGSVSAQSYHQSSLYGMPSGSFMGAPVHALYSQPTYLAPYATQASTLTRTELVFVPQRLDMQSIQGQQAAPELKAEKTLKFKMDKNKSKILFNNNESLQPVFYDFITSSKSLFKLGHIKEEERYTKALVFEQRIKAFAYFENVSVDLNMLKTELKDSKGTTNNKISNIIDKYKDVNGFKGFIEAALENGLAMRSVYSKKILRLILG